MRLEVEEVAHQAVETAAILEFRMNHMLHQANRMSMQKLLLMLHTI